MESKKVMMLGDIGVGKTSLSRRLAFGSFDSDYKATIGVELYTCDVSWELTNPNAVLKFVIWDIDGDFGESVFNRIYIKGASGALIIGDVTRPSTQESMIRLGDRFQEELPGRPFTFVLNKVDLAENAADLAVPSALSSARFPIVKTSAKSGQNVGHAFQTLAASMVERDL